MRLGLHLIKPILFWASSWRSFGKWSDDVEFDWSVVLAIVIGLLFALISNKDWFHKVFRWMGWGSRTSYPSEWYAAFTIFKECYVLLHLEGDRRLRGWPDQWPDQPDKGFFILAEAEWVLGDQVAPLHQVKRIVIPATEVKMVEFLFGPGEVGVPPAELDQVAQLLFQTQVEVENSDHGSESAEPAAQRATLTHDPGGSQPAPQGYW